MFLIHSLYDVIKVDDVIDSKYCQCQQKMKHYKSNESTLWEESNDMYYNMILAKLAKIYAFECCFVPPVSKYGHALVTWLAIFIKQLLFLNAKSILRKFSEFKAQGTSRFEAASKFPTRGGGKKYPLVKIA